MWSDPGIVLYFTVQSYIAIGGYCLIKSCCFCIFVWMATDLLLFIVFDCGICCESPCVVSLVVVVVVVFISLTVVHFFGKCLALCYN